MTSRTCSAPPGHCRHSREGCSRRSVLGLALLCATGFAEAMANDTRLPDSSARSAGGAQEMVGQHRHLRTSDSIRDLLNHPAFAGFSHLILPWDNRQYDEGMRLDRVDALLPYHSHIDPDTTVGALNRMIDDVNKSRPVFYDIYTAAEKEQHPEKSSTGLFFYRGQPGAPFALISPGGGFAYVGSLHEGFPYAAVISEGGYNAFVLKYRAGQGGTVATEDLAAALTYVFRNAETLGVSRNGYSLWGSSAGARMAAAIGSHGAARFGGRDLPLPSTVVMAYTAPRICPSTPPARRPSSASRSHGRRNSSRTAFA